MTKADCIKLLTDTGMNKQEAAEVVDMLTERKKLLAARDGIVRADALAREAAEIGELVKLKAALQRKHTALNILARDAADRDLAEFRQTAPTKLHTKKPWRIEQEAALSLTGGSHIQAFGARQSADAIRLAYYDAWVNEGISRELLKRDGLMGRLFKVDKQLFDDITTEMMEIKPGGNLGITKNADALHAAQVFAKYFELTRVELNKRGAFIGKLAGYTPHTYDAVKIGKQSADDFVNDFLFRLDLEKTFPGIEPAKMREILLTTRGKILTGVDPFEVTAKEKGEFQGPRNLASAMGKHREFFFKDAGAWNFINEKYGKGNIFTATIDRMNWASRKLALMERFGPNPEKMYASILAERVRKIAADTTLSDKARQKAIDALNVNLARREGLVGHVFADVMGETNIPAGNEAARISSATRAWMSITRLGMAVISSMNDLMTYAMNVRFRGQNLFESYTEALGTLLTGRTPEEIKQINILLGMTYDGLLSDMVHRFHAQDAPLGAMSNSMQWFFKWTGLTFWTDRLKAGAARGISGEMAMNAAKGWDALKPEYRAMLAMHGLREADWEILRKGVTTAADGNAYIFPNTIREAGHADLGIKLMALIQDEVDVAVVTPDARTRAFMHQGTRPGTFMGELMRFVMQFKSFPLAFYQKIIKGKRYGRAGQEGFDAMGLGHLIAGSMIFGYAAMSAKDAIKGLTPRDPSKIETWLAAALQGGGAGIWGDFILGKADRFGNAPLETLAGPTLTTAGETAKLISNAVRGDAELADAVRFGVRNTPFINMWWTRAALDWSVLYNLQEIMSPGTLKRRERRLKEEYNQTYLVPPSTVIKQGGGFK